MHIFERTMLPHLLPSLLKIRRATQSLAMLDAILCPAWEYRYYSFNSQWGPGEEMASMRDGSGDDWFLFLCAAGAALKGYAHELAQDATLPSTIQQQVPRALASFLDEPAFAMHEATFCYWRTINGAWHKVEGGLTHDGSEELLKLLVSGPVAYTSWAERYYETPVSHECVEALFAHQSLTDALILALNPTSDIRSVSVEAGEIGYPLQNTSHSVRKGSSDL